MDFVLQLCSTDFGSIIIDRFFTLDLGPSFRPFFLDKLHEKDETIFIRIQL